VRVTQGTQGAAPRVTTFHHDAYDRLIHSTDPLGGRSRVTYDDNGNVLTEVFEGDVVVQSGMFDAVDSVPRIAPNLVGFAFNNRLLLGGLAGNPGPDNPNELSAGDNLTELTIQVHRMFETQSAFLQQIPVYVQLFKEAFPEEAAEAEAAGDLDLLINDGTISRAMAVAR